MPPRLAASYLFEAEILAANSRDTPTNTPNIQCDRMPVNSDVTAQINSRLPTTYRRFSSSPIPRSASYILG